MGSIFTPLLTGEAQWAYHVFQLMEAEDYVQKEKILARCKLSPT